MNDDNFAQPHLIHPSLFRQHGFSPLCKSGGTRMGQSFCPAPQGEARMCLDFLDPLRPIPSRISKCYNRKFHTLKPYYLNKYINITYFTSLPLFWYLLYYEIFVFVVILSC